MKYGVTGLPNDGISYKAQQPDSCKGKAYYNGRSFGIHDPEFWLSGY
jgi:hypothetical protein